MYHTHLENSGAHVIRACLRRPSWISKWPPSNFHLCDILASIRRRDLILMSIHMILHTMNALEAIRILYV